MKKSPFTKRRVKKKPLTPRLLKKFSINKKRILNNYKGGSQITDLWSSHMNVTKIKKGLLKTKETNRAYVTLKESSYENPIDYLSKFTLNINPINTINSTKKNRNTKSTGVNKINLRDYIVTPIKNYTQIELTARAKNTSDIILILDNNNNYHKELLYKLNLKVRPESVVPHSPTTSPTTSSVSNHIPISIHTSPSNPNLILTPRSTSKSPINALNEEAVKLFNSPETHLLSIRNNSKRFLLIVDAYKNHTVSNNIDIDIARVISTWPKVYDPTNTVISELITKHEKKTWDEISDFINNDIINNIMNQILILKFGYNMDKIFIYVLCFLDLYKDSVYINKLIYNQFQKDMFDSIVEYIDKNGMTDKNIIKTIIRNVNSDCILRFNIENDKDIPDDRFLETFNKSVDRYIKSR